MLHYMTCIKHMELVESNLHQFSFSVRFVTCIILGIPSSWRYGLHSARIVYMLIISIHANEELRPHFHGNPENTRNRRQFCAIFDGKSWNGWSFYSLWGQMANFFCPSRVPKLVVLPMHSLSVLLGIMYRLSVIVHYSAYTRCMSLLPLDVVIYILWAPRINVFFYCILPVKNLLFSICYSTINLKVRSEAASCVTFPKYSTHGSSCFLFFAQFIFAEELL